jgi:hypothetical protein
MYSLALIIFVVSEKKAFEHFPIGLNVNLCPAVAIGFCSDIKWKMAATAGLSLTLEPMGKVSQNASSLKPLGQLKPNCPGMIMISDRHKKQKFVEDLPMIIPGQFGFNCPCGFREETF